jgi:hypothetical protein
MQTRSSWFWLIGICFGAFLTSLLVYVLKFKGPNLSKLDQALQAAGYHRYDPPRTNWGPGFVFAGDVSNHRITNVEEICPTLYENIGDPVSAKVIFPDYSATDAFSLQMTLNFMQAKLKGSANLAKLEQKQSVEIRWENIREFSYSHADQWLETGEPRPIPKRCRLAIEDMRLKNRFQNRVFVITRAVAPERLVYIYSEVVKNDTGASLEQSKNLKVSGDSKVEASGKTRLEIMERMFLGYSPPLQLEDWIPTDLLSGEIVRVRGSPSNLAIE